MFNDNRWPFDHWEDFAKQKAWLSFLVIKFSLDSCSRRQKHKKPVKWKHHPSMKGWIHALSSTTPTPPPPVKSYYNLSKGIREKGTHGGKMGKKRVATTDNRWKVFNWLNRSEKMDPYLTMKGAKKQSDLHNSKKFSEGSSNWMITNIYASLNEGGAKNLKNDKKMI